MAPQRSPTFERATLSDSFAQLEVMGNALRAAYSDGSAACAAVVVGATFLVSSRFSEATSSGVSLC
jgi:hypothetical protein